MADNAAETVRVYFASTTGMRGFQITQVPNQGMLYLKTILISDPGNKPKHPPVGEPRGVRPSYAGPGRMGKQRLMQSDFQREFCHQHEAYGYY